jgi:hypothetical protein
MPTSALLLVMMFAINLSAQVNQWRPIRPLEEKHVFVNSGKPGSEPSVVTFIKDTLATPIYKLECHSGDYPDDSEINFSGDFQCALFAVKGRYLRSGDLLAPATDRLNRGRMHAAQLRAPCLDYPEYSTLRHFKLRGMLVTLGFTDPRWRSGKLIGFTLTLSATPDESAASPTPEHVAGPEPPTSCYP